MGDLFFRRIDAATPRRRRVREGDRAWASADAFENCADEVVGDGPRRWNRGDAAGARRVRGRTVEIAVAGRVRGRSRCRAGRVRAKTIAATVPAPVGPRGRRPVGTRRRVGPARPRVPAPQTEGLRRGEKHHHARRRLLELKRRPPEQVLTLFYVLQDDGTSIPAKFSSSRGRDRIDARQVDTHSNPLFALARGSKFLASLPKSERPPEDKVEALETRRAGRPWQYRAAAAESARAAAARGRAREEGRRRRRV